MALLTVELFADFLTALTAIGKAPEIEASFSFGLVAARAAILAAATGKANGFLTLATGMILTTGGLKAGVGRADTSPADPASKVKRKLDVVVYIVKTKEDRYRREREGRDSSVDMKPLTIGLPILPPAIFFQGT